MRTAYTEFVCRRYVCAVRGCSHPAQAHHVRTKGALGKQVDECNVVPLCAHHHTGGAGVHFLGRRTFARKFEMCLPGIALNVYVDWIERAHNNGGFLA